MTLRDLITNHPEWLDHTIVVYTETGDYDYVCEDNADITLPNWRGMVYEAEQMKDITGGDCKPTGIKLLVFSEG